MRIGIVGGGISGISVAFWLEYFAKEKNESLEIYLFEKNSKLGGTIDTFKQNGFTIESGPNGFLDSKPSTVMLFEKAGLKQNLLPSNEKAKKRFIMRDGKLHKLPEKPNEFFSSKLLTFKGKLRVVCELFIPQKKDNYDETIAEFAKRRLGKEALDYLISPMVSGVFAGDPEKLSLKSCFPVIYDLEKEYGGLFKALFKKKGKKSGPAGPGGNLTSYKGGLINGINDLASKLENTKILLNSPVDKVIKENNKFIIFSNGNKYDFDKIIITSPAYISAKFLEPLSKDLSNELSKIHYAPAFVIGFGFKSDDVVDSLDGFGYLIPVNEKRKILGALFTSSIFPERAPSNHKLIRVIMGGDKNRWILNHTPEELKEIALEEIKDTLGIKSRPLIYKYFLWEKAIPQYYQGHNEIVDKVDAICKQIEGIYIGGNLLHGIGINDCTKRSYDIAKEVFL
ncbi:protoporphyrinogen oxidase [Deferribacter autotrophicus]|uniref:Coproporphyrinogen III oxidase n=1 Tax=Deferribacter autotrophicus TaxID=500465 RepID=A0A5A8F263_9BACT|nr:protoporphyrinogen oxidase [Deferribacter autotrophicus]KAA0257415.1 protoporphyrinogen oxidase [Deferribacter autotrophicus]